MSLIPSDLYLRGRSTFAIERRCSFLDPSAQTDIITSSVGMSLPSTQNDQCYRFAGTQAENESGFTTVPIVMHSESGGDVAVASELMLDGHYAPNSRTDSVVFSDGANSITFYNTNSNFDGNTLYLTVIGGVTTTGTVAHMFSFSAHYTSSRGGGSDVLRQNLRFRVDKNRNEISLWLGDQIKGAAAIDGLEQFGVCTWQYVHLPRYHYSHPLYIKQIGLRIEC